MSLVSVSDVRAIVQTDLDDIQLQTIINREEQEVVRKFGAHYTDVSTPVSETVDGGGASLYLKRRALSVSSISEAQSLGGTASSLSSSQYLLYGGQGRLVRLPEGRSWGRSVVVSYVPEDDSALRKQVIVELVRLTLERTSMKGESVAGEYSYSAPDWESERAKLLARLSFEEF